MIDRRSVTAGLLVTAIGAAIRPALAETVVKVDAKPTGVTAEIAPMQFSTLIAAPIRPAASAPAKRLGS